MDLKLEVVVVPVSDLSRAKEFYEAAGFGSTSTTSAVMTPEVVTRAPGR